MIAQNILWMIFITLIPWIELRGSIPYGVLVGIDPITVFIITVIVNILIFFPIFFGLTYLYKYVSEWRYTKKITKKVVEKARKKGKPYIEKYGVIGIAIFIGIPLPGTGVWMGTLIAWLFGLNWKKGFLAAALGVLIAGAIIFTIMMSGATIINGFSG